MKFVCNRFKNMCFMRIFIVMDNDICIFIKFDVRIVLMMCFIFSMNDYCFNNFIFFDNVVWCCLFNGIYDNIVNVSSFVF